jgi:hypothetical protein
LTPNVTALSEMTGFCGTASPNIVIGVCAQAVTASNKIRPAAEDTSLIDGLPSVSQGVRAAAFVSAAASS